MRFSKLVFSALCGMLVATNSYGENPALTLGNPYVLTIPSVDYTGIPGFYQKARIEYLPQTQTWKLAAYVKGVPIPEVNNVELIKTQDVPVQVFLKVSGYLANGCSQVGSTGMAFTNNKFDVYLYYKDENIPPPGILCTQSLVPFSKTIPLPVYSLLAGTYTYNFNGKFSGGFTLVVDNKLP